MPESRQELRTKLQKKLRELFQFDVSDLDFGIYRILNRKRDEIENFIEKDLLDAIEKGLEEYTQDDESKLKKLQQEITNTLGEGAFENGGLAEQYENTPLGKKYLQAKEKADQQVVGEEIEKRIYQDLYTFLSRYYHDGDFLTQRRISTRDSKYAIPYNGEEVTLHWANKDQYYIKTGEHFSNYKFEAGELDVWFKVQQAEVEKDNVKENDTRYFVLRPDEPIEIDEEQDTLILWFEYRPLKDEEEDQWLQIYNEVAGKSLKTVSRDRLCIAFDDWVRSEVTGKWRNALSTMPEGKEHSLLYYKLNHYTAKNTTDYFIHKNLQNFLERELEYYLKHEVIQVDDFIQADSEQPLQNTLTRAKVVRGIAEKVITFLSQIEDFQKKIFEKKKFVVDTHYCFTLDKVPDELYKTILANEEQIGYWEDCYAVDQWEQNLEWNGEWTEAVLKSHPYMMVDTKFLDDDFKYEVVASFDDLDKALGGLNFNADNIQGLNLIEAKYNDKIDSVHIDPPYNTDSSGFLYKNSYRSSSWLSMMNDRLKAAKKLLNGKATLACHIDENEYENLYQLFENYNFPYLSSIIWDKRNPMMGSKGIANQHEYIVWGSYNLGQFESKSENIKKTIKKAQKIIKEYGGVNERSRKQFKKWVKSQKDFSGGERMYHHLENDGRVYRLVAMTWPNPNPAPDQFFKPLTHPETKKKCPVPNRGWSRSPQKMKELLDKNEIEFGDDHTTQPQRKIYLKIDKKKQLSSIISNGSKGKTEIEKFGLDFSYCHPSNLYEEINFATTSKDGINLDFFAGSGTSGQSIISLNRDDGGDRKYIMIEMGQHFNSILKPRLQKVVFSYNWKDGVPQDKDGQSHAFKYHFIESYEDALNNINFKKNIDVQGDFDFKDYLLKYMLNFETKGVSATLLKNEAFKTPFDYELNIQRGHESPTPENVDLVETFHYLIGLWVQTLRRYEHQKRNYVISKGEIRDEDSIEKVLVIWRNTEALDLDKEAEWLGEEIIGDQTFDRIYVNGTTKIKGGEPTEITFREKMFEEVG
jgi:adenine-specific DNA-methyltransferase